MSESECKAEQDKELALLESLYPNQIQRSPDFPEFTMVGIVPYSDNSQTNFVTMDVRFFYAPLYPLSEYLEHSISSISGGYIASYADRINGFDDMVRREIRGAGLGRPIVPFIVEKIIGFLRENNYDDPIPEMSSCAEEQAMELEVLESLFPNELQKSPNDPSEFSLIGIVPYSDQSQTNHVSIDIKFVYPQLYPLESSLQYHVTKISGGNIASDTSKINLLDETIRTEIETAGLGYPIVYQVVEKIVEFLREHNREEMSLHDQMLEEKVPKKEFLDDDSDDSHWSGSSSYDSDYSGSLESEDEEEDYKGLQIKNLCLETERVTDNEFSEWKSEYDKWLMSNGWIKRVAESDLRPTGKQQFLALLTAKRGAADKIDEEFDEDLFGEDDDIDEEDLVGDC